jgi:hypothetical protein
MVDCVQTDTNKCKITNSKERSKKHLTGRRQLRRRRSALDCSAIEEEEKEEEEEEETKKKKRRRNYKDCVASSLRNISE